MIDHLEIRTRLLTENVDFYSALLQPLGYSLKVDDASKGFGDATRLDFFIVEGEPSAEVHFAFEAGTRALVDEIYDIGRMQGYQLDRTPALAPHVHPNYYAGYLRDPDGRLVEIVCHREE